MLHIVLYQPEIPPNTGNIVRLAANTGSRLHLVKPMGFRLDEKSVTRAGMDYAEFADVREHENWEACRAELTGKRLFALSTRGTTRYDSVQFMDEDVVIFGPETRGLPAELLESLAPKQRLRLPMQPGNRSVNLSNSVAVVVFEAWRQRGFPGGA